MAIDYRGTGVYGVFTGAKEFWHTGVDAKNSYYYLNTQSGHVYQCTTPGVDGTAKWEYRWTEVLRKPGETVRAMCAPTRGKNGSTVYTVNWDIPQIMRDSTNCERIHSFKVEWSLGITGTDPKKTAVIGGNNTKSATCNINNFVTDTKTYRRNSFFPLTKTKLAYLTCKVSGRNDKGVGKAVTQTRKFEVPRKPTISGGVVTAGRGEVTFTVKTDPGNDYRERYDTEYWVIVKNTRTGKTTTVEHSSTTSTSFTKTYDVTDYQQLDYDQYVRITVRARARGLAGQSDIVERSYTMSYPAQVTMKAHSVSSRDTAGKATFPIKTNTSTDHPVDEVRLEYLANTTYEKSAQIPGDAVFTDADIVDDGQCTALSVGVANLIPDAGRYTWVRVRSWHAIESTLYRLSAPQRMRELETPAPTAADEEVTIVSALSGDDGESAEVILGWNADGQDDSTGTELSWSEAENAWKSTEDPDSYQFTWSDGRLVDGSTTYQDSATITIKGLSQGVNTFIKARRYREGETVTYSDYSNQAVVMPSVAPSDVVLDVDTYVPYGTPIQCEWTFAGGGTQTAWQLLTEDGQVVAGADDARGVYSISAERAAALAVDDVLTLRVEVATGGAFVSSGWYAVQMVPAPTLAITVADTLTVQPLGFAAEASEPCVLAVSVTSQGVDGATPAGNRLQPAGDTVWAGEVRPVWTSGQDSETATITLPGGLDFLQNGVYTVTVRATSIGTGLKSEYATAEVAVDWATSAEAPDAAEITPTVSQGGDDGRITRTATISWALTGEGYGQDDVVDIYRVTGDGATLIGENYPLTAEVVDEFAPFGMNLTHYYRLAVRTPDGDVAWDDFEYVLEGGALRFDWPTGWLELPYNITVSDAYSKQMETRTHLDGSTSAYYNDGANRTASLSSQLARLLSQEEIDKCRELARYPGTVFVRTPDGSAYEADVQVSGMDTDGPVQTVSIGTTEVTATAAYALPVPEAEEEGE